MKNAFLKSLFSMSLIPINWCLYFFRFFGSYSLIVFFLNNSCFGAELKEDLSIFCEQKRPLPRPDAHYPLSERSPLESLKEHDAVFLGEVIVPLKKCSLDFCAGLKVHQMIKGNLVSGKAQGAEENLLVRIKQSSKDSEKGNCLSEDLFSRKNQYWYVFAHTGTSRRGFFYYEVSADGPSFPTKVRLDFTALEKGFQSYKKDLDHAIKATLGLSYQ